jgi:transcriptional regulator with XRE-family HTH domain
VTGEAAPFATRRAELDIPLGEWIRRSRVKQSFSQKALAERAGISRSYLCDIERGRSATPSVASLDKLAIALGVGRSDILRVAGIIEQQLGSTGDAGERRLVSAYRDLSHDGKNAVERFARFLHDEENRFVQQAFSNGAHSGEEVAENGQTGPTLFDLSSLHRG